MKIQIVLFKKNISWDDEWIYLGKSFEKLSHLEKKISGNRIKINKYFSSVFESEISIFLDWIDKKSKKTNDSLFWWMNELSGKNNFATDFFLYICQIKSLKKYSEGYDKNEIFLIVVEDYYLLKALKENLHEKDIIFKNNLNLRNIINRILHFRKIIFSFAISIIENLSNYLSANITKTKLEKPKGDIYLIHAASNFKSLLKNKNIVLRFFPKLDEFLDKKNKNYYFLVWSFPFLKKKIQIFKKLRLNKTFVPEDWLTLKDYFLAYKNFFNAKNELQDNVGYKNFNINSLLEREKKLYLEKIHYFIRFWTYSPSINKWGSEINSLTIIDHYENMIYERALISAAKKLNIRTKIIGYHHTLTSREFTAWHSTEAEWKSRFKPNFVLSFGTISSNLLKKQGVPSNKILEGPALRFEKFLKKKLILNKNEKNILVPLSQIRDASLELIVKIISLSKELRNTDYKFIIKPHPNVDIKKITRNLGYSTLPSNIEISDNEMETLLDKSLFTISMATGAAYDAVLSGSIVLTLESELSLFDNYLDIFKKDFDKYVRKYDVSEIKFLLLNFVENKKTVEEYKSNFYNLRDTMLKGMNKPEDKYLTKFL